MDFFINSRFDTGIGPEAYGSGKRKFSSSGSVGDLHSGLISGRLRGSGNREKVRALLATGLGSSHPANSTGAGNARVFMGLRKTQAHRRGAKPGIFVSLRVAKLYKSPRGLPSVASCLPPETAGPAVAASGAAVKLAVEGAVVGGFSFDGGKSLGKGGGHDHPVFDPLFFIA